jgi:hypothetical protein
VITVIVFHALMKTFATPAASYCVTHVLIAANIMRQVIRDSVADSPGGKRTLSGLTRDSKIAASEVFDFATLRAEVELWRLR